MILVWALSTDFWCSLPDFLYLRYLTALLCRGRGSFAYLDWLWFEPLETGWFPFAEGIVIISLNILISPEIFIFRNNIMDELVPVVPEGGNTISPSVKQISPAICWCFTLNNYTIQDCSSIVLIIRKECKKAIVGYEVGEECGTPHLQGYFEFKMKKRPIGVFGIKGMSFRKAKGSDKQNDTYCGKGKDVLLRFGYPRPIEIIENLYP